MKQRRSKAKKKSSAKNCHSLHNKEQSYEYIGIILQYLSLTTCVVVVLISLHITARHSQNNRKLLATKYETNVANELNDVTVAIPKLLFNAYDLKIENKIYEGERYKRQHDYPECISHFENLIRKHPKSPQAVYGQAVCLGLLAEQMRSDEIQIKSIEAFGNINLVPDVPKELLKLALLEKAEKELFTGKRIDSLKTLVALSKDVESDIDVLEALVEACFYANLDLFALPYIDQILRIDSSNSRAKCHKGSVLQQVGKNEEAIKYLTEGMRNIPSSDVKQDLFYDRLGDAYTRIGKQNEAWKVYQEAAEKGIFLSAEQRSVYNAKTTLRAQPIWTAEQAGYKKEISLLEYHWKTIRSEAMSILNNEKNGFKHQTANLLQQGDWRQFELYVQARKIKSNCAKTPKTCSVIDQMSAAATNKRGQVKFSVMQPATHIWPHTGPTNCRLRAHLGLKIPKNTSIRVSSHTTTWKEGKILIIDDSFEHEVWHNGSESRLILIVDFWHPDIPDWERRELTPI